MSGPKVISVNISEKKGPVKHPVEEITLTGTGVLDDAHAGNWHRQVSLLAVESVEKFSKQAKRPIRFGEFAENITTQGSIFPRAGSSTASGSATRSSSSRRSGRSAMERPAPSSGRSEIA